MEVPPREVKREMGRFGESPNLSNGEAGRQIHFVCGQEK